MVLSRRTERWPSGRRRTPGKCVGGEPSPGFESLSLRHYPHCEPVTPPRRARIFPCYQRGLWEPSEPRRLATRLKWLRMALSLSLGEPLPFQFCPVFSLTFNDLVPNPAKTQMPVANDIDGNMDGTQGRRVARDVSVKWRIAWVVSHPNPPSKPVMKNRPAPLAFQGPRIVSIWYRGHTAASQRRVLRAGWTCADVVLRAECELPLRETEQ